MAEIALFVFLYNYPLTDSSDVENIEMKLTLKFKDPKDFNERN